jgi:16S rRNA (cytosine1402-N4)-methyltransferase
MTNNTSELHRPVMLERTIDLLRPAIEGKKAIVVDCTLGLGGHTEALLTQFPELKVIGIDRDDVALGLATQRLEEFGERFIPVAAIFDELHDVLTALEIDGVEGILMDLGVSSMQLDQAERGFSYAQDAELDMRMNQSGGKTAADILASYDHGQLARIFRDYGEERFASQVAREIVNTRELHPIKTSSQLNAILERTIPKAPGKFNSHPGKRVYQALRIAVNDELGVLERAMPQAIDALRVAGRIVVMSYHSLEDGIVKKALQQAAMSTTPIEMPVELPGTSPRLNILTRGVERATEVELSKNPRAQSARLRAAEKLEVR